MDGLTEVIQQLESQRDAIDKALEALRGIEGSAARGGGNGTGIAALENKRSIAQKARWAAVKGAKKRGGLTAEGRARLAENMRKRWAAKRTAAQAKKRGRKAR
jgi:hypothetical protein